MIQDKRIVFLRIRRHLRRVGLGRLALIELFRSKLVEREEPLLNRKPFEDIKDKSWMQFRRLVESTRRRGDGRV